jgi:hypothetical protein
MCWILSLHEEKIREKLMEDVMAEAINKGGQSEDALIGLRLHSLKVLSGEF